jgi:cytochrome c
VKVRAKWQSVRCSGARRHWLAALAGGSFLIGSAMLSAQAPTVLHGDPERGKRIYQVCSGCHSLDEDDVGPRHRGVVGRMAGTVPGFGYSPALKGSHIVWTEENLDRWLTNPQALVPGAMMFFQLPGAKDRADVIAWLALQR